MVGVLSKKEKLKEGSVRGKNKGNEMELNERLEELQNQQKQMEANFHQVTGAIAVIQQMMNDQEEAKKESSKKEDKK